MSPSLALAAALILNPQVTPATIHQTICVPGFATTYRRHHPVRVPARRGYIRDHIVSIELGGSSAKANIQYQTRADSLAKDRLEDALRDAVCAGRVQLIDAQTRMEEWKP